MSQLKGIRRKPQHADLPKEKRERNGINERLLRLSVDIEDAGDIIADLEQALGRSLSNRG